MGGSNVDDRSNPFDDDIASAVAVTGTTKGQNPANQKKGQADKDKTQPFAEAQPKKGKKGKQPQGGQQAAKVVVVTETPEGAAANAKKEPSPAQKGDKSKGSKQKAEATAPTIKNQAEVKPVVTKLAVATPANATATTAMIPVDHIPGGGRVVRYPRGLVMQRPHVPDGAPTVSNRVRLPPLYTLLPCFGQTWHPPPLARLPSFQVAHQQAMAPVVTQMVPLAQTAAPVVAAVEEPKPESSSKKDKKKVKTPPPSSVSSASASSTASKTSKSAAATPIQPVVINIYTNRDEPTVKRSDEESEAKEAKEPQASPKAKAKKPEPAKKVVKTVKKTVVVAEESDVEEEAAEPVVQKVKKKVQKTTEVVQTSDVEEETPAPIVKKVKKVTKKVEILEESEDEEPEPAVKAVKKVKKVEVVETSDAEEEEITVKKKGKTAPVKVIQKSKQVKKTVVEEETVPATKAGSTTSASTVSAKSKHSAASSNTSTEAPRPVNSRMQGSGRYEGGKTTTKPAKNDDEKEDAKEDQEKKELDPYRDTSSVNSSKRGKKPAEKKEEPQAGGFQMPFMPGGYPGPMYGGPGPQAYPMSMMPGAALYPGPAKVKKPPSRRDSATTVSDQPAKSSADQAPNLVPATRPPPSGSKKSSGPKSHHSHRPHVDSGSRTPSDLSIHMPHDWRGTITIKDPAVPARDKDLPDRHVRSRAPSAASRKSVLSDTRTAVLNDMYSPIVEEVKVRLHHHHEPLSDFPRSHTHSHRHASSPTPRTQQPASTHHSGSRAHSRSRSGSIPKHNQRVWQHPEHPDVFEVYSISTHDGFSPSQRRRDIRPEDSASQVGSRKREPSRRPGRDGSGGGSGQRRVIEEITVERTRIVPALRDVPVGRADTIITLVEDDRGDGGRRESGSKRGATDVGGGGDTSYRDHRSEDSRQSHVGSRVSSYRRPGYLNAQGVQDVEEEKVDWEDGKAEWDHGQGNEDGGW